MNINKMYVIKPVVIWTFKNIFQNANECCSIINPGNVVTHILFKMQTIFSLTGGEILLEP